MERRQDVPSPDTTTFVLEQVRAQVEAQGRDWEALRTKASIVLGSAGVIFGRMVEWKPDTGLAWAVFGSAGLLLLGACTAAAVCMWPRTVRMDPNPRPFAEIYLGRALSVVQTQLISNLVDTYEFNRVRLARMTRILNLGFLAFTLALFACCAVATIQWSKSWKADDQTSAPTTMESLRQTPLLRLQTISPPSIPGSQTRPLADTLVASPTRRTAKTEPKSPK